MTDDFLGVGWSFPIKFEIQPDSLHLKAQVARYEENIHQAIEIILGTARGERQMRPDFGCGIHNLVFAVNTAGTTAQMVSEIYRSLLQWEPRIDVLDVRAAPGERENILLFEIDYRVRTTNNAYNMVYPFYLERGTT